VILGASEPSSGDIQKLWCRRGVGHNWRAQEHCTGLTLVAERCLAIIARIYQWPPFCDPRKKAGQMDAEKLLSYELPLFEGMHAKSLADHRLEVAEIKLDAWQTVFDQHDRSNDVFFLIDGSLLAVYWTEEGREIVFSRFPKGAYFGELSAFDRTPRSLAVFAKTEAKLLLMKRDCFLQLVDKVKPVRDRVILDLAKRVRLLTDRSTEMTTLSVEQRVGTYLLRLAAEQGKLAAGSIIENAPTHSEIAGTIGANREMVSRSVSKLAKRGIIKSSRQRIEICDPEGLSENSSKLSLSDSAHRTPGRHWLHIRV